MEDVFREIEALEEEFRRIEGEVRRRYAERREEIIEGLRRYRASEGLREILLVEFSLPSVDLKSRRIRVEGLRREMIERRLDPEDIKRIQSLRTRFYRVLREHGGFKLGERTWALVPVSEEHEMELVEALNRVLGEFNAILEKYGVPPRTVSLVEGYVPAFWLAEKIAEAIVKYREDLDQLLRELEEEELTEARRRTLRRQANRLRRILETLAEELRSTLREVEAKPRIEEYIALEPIGSLKEEAWSEPEARTQTEKAERQPRAI